MVWWPFSASRFSTLLLASQFRSSLLSFPSPFLVLLNVECNFRGYHAIGRDGTGRISCERHTKRCLLLREMTNCVSTPHNIIHGAFSSQKNALWVHRYPSFEKIIVLHLYCSCASSLLSFASHFSVSLLTDTLVSLVSQLRSSYLTFSPGFAISPLTLLFSLPAKLEKLRNETVKSRAQYTEGMRKTSPFRV